MKRFVESNIPEHLRLHVRYLHTFPHHWTSVANLYDKNTDTLLATGTAVCSKKDNPSRKIGRAICVGRALKEYSQGARL